MPAVSAKPKKPRILIFFCVYEAERSFAAGTLEQLLDVWSHCVITLHIHDDASPSQLGYTLSKQFSRSVLVRVTRLERSRGFHGLGEYWLSFLHQSAACADRYDYVVRVDADIHLGSRRLGDLLRPDHSPSCGLLGNTLAMRHRDFLLWIADLTPAGLRRKLQADGRMEHRWELGRTRPVWWSDIGWRALRQGFRGRIVTGPLQILASPTLIAIEQSGWLARPRSATGFIFQDDVLLSMMVHALGHPILDIRKIIDGWNATCFLAPGTPIKSILASRFDFLHPLKNNSWAHQVRAALPLPSSGSEPRGRE
jgi:hypothetical protein